jgi:iron uptake system component EfeO
MPLQAVFPAVLVLVMLAAGCGSSEDPPAGARMLSFKLTDEGCEPQDAEITAGPVTFEAEGASSYVTELEVLEDESVIGEKEDLTEGLTGSFTLSLDPGEYTLRCSLGSGEDGTLTVTAH